MRSIQLIREELPGDCGPAALAMVAQLHGCHLTLGRSRQLMRASAMGTTAREIVLAARSVPGLWAEGFSVVAPSIGALPLPVIVHLLSGHFTVLHAVCEEHVELADSARGFVTVLRENFERQISGTAIVVRACRARDVRRARARRDVRHRAG